SKQTSRLQKVLTDTNTHARTHIYHHNNFSRKFKAQRRTRTTSIVSEISAA
ncbi:hypothetical protein L9F63_014133, partial [Diploptera punctata]